MHVKNCLRGPPTEDEWHYILLHYILALCDVMCDLSYKEQYSCSGSSSCSPLSDRSNSRPVAGDFEDSLEGKKR